MQISRSHNRFKQSHNRIDTKINEQNTYIIVPLSSNGVIAHVNLPSQSSCDLLALVGVSALTAQDDVRSHTLHVGHGQVGFGVNLELSSTRAVSQLDIERGTLLLVSALNNSISAIIRSKSRLTLKFVFK